jgi:integrase
MLSLGTYPDVGLSAARARRDEARRLIAAGTDPSAARKELKAANVAADEVRRLQASGKALPGSFEAVARDWFEVKRGDWSAGYGEKVFARLVADVFPHLGARPIADLTPPDLLQVFRRIEERGAIETAHRAMQECSMVFRYAVANRHAASDPCRDLRGQLRKPVSRHFPAITNPARLAELLRACDAYAGTLVVRTALKLAPLLFVRPGELRHAQWSEFNLEAGTWTIPAERMKRTKQGKLTGAPHLVPLPTQAVAALRELQPLTGEAGWVFQGERHRDRPMSENTVNAALRAMGFPKEEATGHGFRATARTLLAERLGQPEAAIEAQLAHDVPDALGRAYNRTEWLAQRFTMMQAWADYLDKLRIGADVVVLSDHEKRA